MKKLNTKYSAGFLDFLTGGKKTLPEDKVDALNKFKNDVFTIYKKLNNAYKIYFQGAKLKQQQEYVVQEYKDENGIIRERKVPKETPSNKIDFQGNWKFKLDGEKTSLGQAIHSLYAFLTNIEKIKYETVKKNAPKKEEPKDKSKEEQKPKDKMLGPSTKPITEKNPVPPTKPVEIEK